MIEDQLTKFKQAVLEQVGGRRGGCGRDGGCAYVKGVDIQHLEQVKALRRELAPSISFRYWFRGPRGKSGAGTSQSFTLKQNAHSFDIYLR